MRPRCYERAPAKARTLTRVYPRCHRPASWPCTLETRAPQASPRTPISLLTSCTYLVVAWLTHSITDSLWCWLRVNVSTVSATTRFVGVVLVALGFCCATAIAHPSCRLCIKQTVCALLHIEDQCANVNSAVQAAGDMISNLCKSSAAAQVNVGLR